VNIAIRRAFIRLRQPLAGHGERAAKVAELERGIERHAASSKTLFEAIRQLMAPPERTRRSIGFWVEEPGVLCRVQRGPPNGT
jgi:hypothetical protein